MKNSLKEKIINGIVSNLNGELNNILEFHGDRYIFVTGCRKILKYSKEEVIMDCKKYKLTVLGKGLIIEKLINGQLSVEGKIEKTEFGYDTPIA